MCLKTRVLTFLASNDFKRSIIGEHLFFRVLVSFFFISRNSKCRFRPGWPPLVLETAKKGQNSEGLRSLVVYRKRGKTTRLHDKAYALPKLS